MDSILEKLTEIENTAAAIVNHAEEQKDVLDREYEQKRKDFDQKLEKETQEHLMKIRQQLEKETSEVLDSQGGASTDMITKLQKEYEEKHTEYAQEILKRITEV